MKKTKYFIIVLAIVGIFLFGINLQAQRTTININLGYYDENTDEVEFLASNAYYGSLFTFEAPNIRNEQTFLYWIVNGKLRTDLKREVNIVVQSKLDLIAVYKPDNKHAVFFVDTNGDVIDKYPLFVTEQDDINVPAEPKKPQSTFLGYVNLKDDYLSAEPSKTVLKATQSEIYVAKYNISSTTNYKLNVDSNITKSPNKTKYKLNEEVTLTAEPTSGGKAFSYFIDEQGSIISTKNIISVSITANREIKAIYGDQNSISASIVSIVGPLSLTAGFNSFVGKFELNENHTLIEHAFEFVGEDDEIIIAQSNVYNQATNEYLMTFPLNVEKISAYLIYEDQFGSLIKITSSETAVFATDLFISEYIEGSGYNKALEIYNGTGMAVDLSKYKIRTFVNGAENPSTLLQLEGFLEHGETFVISSDNKNTSSILKNKANLLSNSQVMTFNGNDVIALYKNDSIIDLIGIVGDEENFAINVTLVRNSDVTSPSPIWEKNEWAEYGIDTFDYLGNHEIDTSDSIIYDINRLTYVEENLELQTFFNVNGYLNLFQSLNLGAHLSFEYKDEGNLYNNLIDLETGLVEMPEVANTHYVSLIADIVVGEFQTTKEFEVIISNQVVSDARDAASGNDVHFHGVVTGIAESRYIYVSDPDGTTIHLYNPTIPNKLWIGDLVVVEGQRDNFNGQQQIYEPIITIVDKNKPLPPTLEFEFIPDFIEADQGKRFTIRKLIATKISPDNRTLTVKDENDNTVLVYIDPANATLNTYLTTLVGEEVILKNIHLGWWYSEPQFLLHNNRQIVTLESENEDWGPAPTVESSVELNSFYNNIGYVEGNVLKAALHNLLWSEFAAISYGDVRYALEESDVLLSDSTKVYGIYDSKIMPAVWDATTWHREHVWPQSYLTEKASNSKKNIASDLHNLRAIVPSTNSSRSNRYFAEGSGQNQTIGTTSYYPGDDHRGDVARIMFYMIVMYPDLNLTALVEEINLETYTMGLLDVLINWHEEDPVSDFEMNRNNIIYIYQKNRNPFIDKPEYVAMLFSGEDLHGSNEDDYQNLVFVDVIYSPFYKQLNGVFVN